jgi:regulatory protein
MESAQPQLTYKEALSKATEICSHSEKCSYDIMLKCREWQLPREETTKVIEYLLKEKYLDQQRYATSFVRDKFRFNKWGKIKLAYALRQKQVEEQYSREALSQLPAEDYQKVLRDLLSAKARTLKEQDTWSRRNKLLAFAQSHGFEVDLALPIIEQIK